jgi:response regulator RpfG family c-di-GMP phosphodiesterase
MILKQSGRHFDPDLVDIYMKNKNTILEIKTRIVG